jgi:hypothetical protein
MVEFPRTTGVIIHKPDQLYYQSSGSCVKVSDLVRQLSLAQVVHGDCFKFSGLTISAMAVVSSPCPMMGTCMHDAGGAGVSEVVPHPLHLIRCTISIPRCRPMPRHVGCPGMPLRTISCRAGRIWSDIRQSLSATSIWAAYRNH